MQVIHCYWQTQEWILLLTMTMPYDRQRVMDTQTLLGYCWLTLVDPTADENYAIHWASYNGHRGVVDLLLADHQESQKV